MKTPRSDQEDLIRLTLQEDERFVYDETNTGHEDAAESKGPDQVRGRLKNYRRRRDIRIARARLERPRVAKEEGWASAICQSL